MTSGLWVGVVVKLAEIGEGKENKYKGGKGVLGFGAQKFIVMVWGNIDREEIDT